MNISEAFWTLQASKINNTDVMSQYHLRNKNTSQKATETTIFGKRKPNGNLHFTSFYMFR